MLQTAKTYDELYRNFRWVIPPDYNIGVDVCDRWAAADPARIAIVHLRADGRTEEVTFGALKEQSDRLANVLRAHEVQKGDTVTIYLPMTPEAAYAMLACARLGAGAVCLLSGGAAGVIGEHLDVPHTLVGNLVLEGLLRLAVTDRAFHAAGKNSG